MAENNKKPLKKVSPKKSAVLKDVKSDDDAPEGNRAGHNSGVNPQLQELVQEIIELDEKKKELAKAQRDLRNRAKTEFGVLSTVLAHEIKLRKMDQDVRIQFESGHHDLKEMLGYQASLDLAPNTVARTEHEYVDPSDPAAEANRLLNRG